MYALYACFKGDVVFRCIVQSINVVFFRKSKSIMSVYITMCFSYSFVFVF